MGREEGEAGEGEVGGGGGKGRVERGRRLVGGWQGGVIVSSVVTMHIKHGHMTTH